MVNDGNRRLFNQMPNRPRFKPGGGGPPQSAMNRAMLYDANQLGDNPGFLDFNDDSISFPSTGTRDSNNGLNSGTTSTGGGLTNGAEASQNGPNMNGNRRLNPGMKRPMQNGAGMRPRMNNGPNWGPPMAPPNSFPGPSPVGRRGQMHPPAIPPLPPPPGAHFRNGGPGMGRPMRGPHNGRFGSGPPRPMPLLPMNAPLPPPVPPMGVGQPMPPPPGMGRMLPPPIRPPGMLRRQPNGLFPGMGPRMHAFARNGMAAPNGNANGNRIGTRGKPAPPNRDPFALDKPWVTEQIKAEHDKKEELANRLKGHRDDALFAQFKEQRDKFVKMYEAARLEFIGKQQSEQQQQQQQDVDKNLTEPMCKKPRVEKESESSGRITIAPVTPVETPINTQKSVNDGVTIAATSSTTTTAPTSTSSPTSCEISDTNEVPAITPAPTEAVTESSATANIVEDASVTAETKIS